MTSDDIEKSSRDIEELRIRLLFGDEGDLIGMPPMCEQQYLMALAALDLATRHMKMAHYYAMRRE